MEAPATLNAPPPTRAEAQKPKPLRMSRAPYTLGTISNMEGKRFLVSSVFPNPRVDQTGIFYINEIAVDPSEGKTTISEEADVVVVKADKLQGIQVGEGTGASGIEIKKDGDGLVRVKLGDILQMPVLQDRPVFLAKNADGKLVPADNNEEALYAVGVFTGISEGDDSGKEKEYVAIERVGGNKLTVLTKEPAPVAA